MAIILAWAALARASTAAPAGTPVDGTWQDLAPPVRTEAAAIFDPVRNRLVVFGGFEAFTRGEVWTLALDGPALWTLAVPAGTGPNRHSASAIYDPGGDRMIVYGGGSTVPGPAGSLWSLSLSSPMTWSPITTASPGPTTAVGQSAIYDPVGKRMIVYAGVGGGNKVWALSLTGTPDWTELLPGAGPVDRYFHSAIYDTLRHRMVIYGGTTGSDPPLNDVWALSLDGAPAWTQIPALSASPNSRLHTAIYDPVGDRMVVFGGSLGNETWALPLSAISSWQNLPVGSTRPFSRLAQTAIYDGPRARMVVYGGDGSYDFSDTWGLDLATPAWSLIAPATLSPGWRERHSTIVDPLRDRMIMFGGSTSGLLQQLGLWTLSLDAPETWSILQPSGPIPSARTGASTIYDPRRDRMIVFGGQTGAGTDKANDLWSLSLRDLPPAWTPLAASGTPPSTRAYHSAVYDPLNDRMLVFGGENDVTQPLSDLWQLSLDGTPAWSPLSPTGGPPAPRDGHAAIVDPLRERMIVFGGRNVNGVPYLDAWELSLRGAPAWSFLSPSGAAPPRVFQPGIYDPVRDRFIVLGGDGPSGRLNDVRAMSLGPSPAWSPLTMGGVVPDDRSGETAVYDPIHDRLVMFGGGFVQRANSLWQLSFGDPPAAAPAAACPGDISWIAGTSSGVSYDVTNPFAFADTVDYQVTSERNWPGYPIRGSVAVAALDHALIAFGAPVPDTAAVGLNALVLRATLRRAGWSVECSHHLHDVTTPTQLALVSADPQPDRVTLRWFGDGAVGRGTVERCGVDLAWQVRGEANADGRGGYAYQDREVVPGVRYGYRLAIADGSETTRTTVAWVDVPAAWSLALQGARPNPSPTLTIAFTLADASPATLDLWDVAGRRIESRRVENLGPGAHQVRIAEGRQLAPGLYLARLTQHGRSLTARAVVCR